MVKEWDLGLISVSFFPYQLALGCSIRYWEGSLLWRLYVGPIKIWGS